MIIDILNEISSTSSRLEKEAILKREENNDLLKKVFFLAYDPFTQFYIRKIPKYRTDQRKSLILEDAISLLTHLSERVYTGNAGIAHLTSVLEQCTEPTVIERIIQKDLKCGASESTANKIWPGLIHEYPCMLCTPSDEKVLSKIKFPAMAQLKMDGMRFNAIVKSGACEFRSRNGKEINLLGNLESEFIALSQGKDVVFDGELVVEADDKYLDRQTGNGVLNKAVKGTISDAEAKQVCATIWDVLPYEDFTNCSSHLDYKTRFERLKSLPIKGKVRLVEHTLVESLDQAREVFESYLSQGQEGIILKDLSGKWESKRVKHQVKFKGELECDLEVIGYEEGTGKYTGKLGALVCSSRSENGKTIEVSVGSGFNDSDRDHIWSIRDSVLGKIVALKYNAKIKNKNGEESLFLPVFLEIREDKTAADSYSAIK